VRRWLKLGHETKPLILGEIQFRVAYAVGVALLQNVERCEKVSGELPNLLVGIYLCGFVASLQMNQYL
jgi:hypothetical protein